MMEEENGGGELFVLIGKPRTLGQTHCFQARLPYVRNSVESFISMFHPIKLLLYLSSQYYTT
jgi:hypothetical protein